MNRSARAYRVRPWTWTILENRCSTKSLLAGDGEIIAQIYKERVIKRGYGSGSWGW